MTDLEKTIRLTNAISSTIETLRKEIANHEKMRDDLKSKLDANVPTVLQSISPFIMLEDSHICGLKESIAVLQHEVEEQLPQLAHFQASGIDTGNAFDLTLD